MALRIVKRHVPSVNSLNVATSVASFVKDVSNASQFAPVAVSATLILTILDLIQVKPFLLRLGRDTDEVCFPLISLSQSIKTNQVQCFELARRAAKLLLDIVGRMENKWHDAPPSLIANIREFEEYGVQIPTYLQKSQH